MLIGKVKVKSWCLRVLKGKRRCVTVYGSRLMRQEAVRGRGRKEEAAEDRAQVYKGVASRRGRRGR